MKTKLSILFLFYALTNVISPVSAQRMTWAKSYKPATSYVIPQDIFRHKGFVYAVGLFLGTVDFDQGAGTVNRTSINGYLSVYVTKIDTNGNFQWAQVFGASNGDTRVLQVTVDSKGNVYSAGRFTGNCDFDPGTGTFSISTIPEHYFIQKLNAAGNFVWAKAFGVSEQNETFSDITIDPFGNVITIGSFNDSIDIDPGTARVVLRRKTMDDPDGFLQKLDSNGNYINGFSIEPRLIGSIAFDQNAIYLVGSYYGNQDIKPGPDTSYLYSNSARRPFVMKLDHSLNLIWAKPFASEGGAASIFKDSKGNLCIFGGYTKTADFDPGTSQYTLTYTGYNYNPDYYYLQLDTAGTFLSAKSHYLGTGTPYVYCTYLDAQNNFYFAGKFRDLIDLDPGPGVYNLKSNTKYIGFICKYDANYNFLWAHSIGDTTTSNDVIITSISTDQNLNVYGGIGFTSPIDCDPDTAKYKLIPITTLKYDAAFFKWRQSACNNMAIFVDSMKNAGCNVKGRMRVRGVNGKTPYTYEWSTSPVNYTAAIGYSNSGTYTVTVRDKDRCFKQATYMGFGPDVGSGFDVQADLISSEFRPGFRSIIRLDAYNALCTPVSGELKLVLNNLLQYDSAFPSPSARRGDTLVWAYSNLDYNSQHIKPIVYVTVSTSAKIGNVSCLDLLITPKNGDVKSGNNTKTYCKGIVNGYDPNDKNVYPAGACTERYILKTDEPEYTIRFQNTGNSMAINIIIIDSLDANLDISTLKVLAKSHDKLICEPLKGNAIKFTFNSILLPDSGSDVKGSQGYIIFKVKQKANLANGIKIRNRSFIYFDYNPAVITNTVFNTIASSIPVDNSTVAKASCDSLLFGEHTYKKSGSYNVRFFGSDGCDSIVKLNLTIKKSGKYLQNTIACDSFFWDNTLYKSSGLYSNILSNYAGCDSTRTLQLTIKKPSFRSLSEKACDSFKLNNQVYKTGGTYIQTLTNAANCDSVLTLNLEITKSSSQQLTESSCSAYTLNSVVYNTSGQYEQHVTNYLGCDSTIKLNLTIHTASTHTIQATACRVFVLKNQVYRKSGLYPVAVLTNYTGCDSIVRLNLQIDTVNTSVTQNNETLTANLSGAAYQWINCSNNAYIPSAQSQTYVATANGSYAVEINDKNCKDTSACYAVSTLGIDDIINSNVFIAPNPSRENIHVVFNAIQNGTTVSVIDISGKILSEYTLTDVSDLLVESWTGLGVYFIRIANANGIRVFKVIRE